MSVRSDAQAIMKAALDAALPDTAVKKALKDLMTRYAPVVEMWFDGNHAGNFNWPAVNQVVSAMAAAKSSTVRVSLRFA